MSVLKQVIEGIFKNTKKYEAKESPKEKKDVSPGSDKRLVEEQQQLEREFLKMKDDSSKKDALEKIVGHEEVKWKTFEEEENHLKKQIAEHIGVATYKSHSVNNPEGDDHNNAYHSNGQGHNENQYQSNNQSNNYQH